jgi:transcriptional regulator with XRE-family HTH domain
MSNSQDFLKQVGENIRYFRRKANLSQEELAIKANLSTSFIGGVERGVDNISIESVYRIAEALSIEPYLFFVSEVHRSNAVAKREKE